MERLKKKKGKRAATVAPTPLVVLNEGIDQLESVAPSIEKSKKHSCREDVFDDVVVRFSADTCLYFDPSSMLKEVDKLLFLEDENRLTKIVASQVINWGLTVAFQALQSQIFLKKDVKNLSKKVTSLSWLNSKLKKEVKATKYESTKVMKEVIDKLAKVEEENAQLRVSFRLSEE
ncbi:hypothetical protein LWI29_011199 [Acer saccharum]|uniref:Uncharacterized protein n=1 Tax=Acer saccharum TaxID=4024 RepID=A0AA39SAN7_ACESA|nr:hypothetical protein LWI29_011199 [Acer saccharum]